MAAHRAPDRVPQPRWIAVDWAVAGYATLVAVIVVIRAEAIPEWPLLVGAHGALLVGLALLPPRGAAWETPAPDDRWPLATVRRVGRFVRHMYPALLLTPFFEETQFMVNAITPAHPYWFESYLYDADRALFGALPAVVMSGWTSPLLDEVMHALYLSYYPLLVSGLVIAWMGPRPAGTRSATAPGPGYQTAMTSMMLAFFLAYVWYPWLPARGPWENDQLMRMLPPFQGVLFTPVTRSLIDGVAVSGGCFPSAHVAGAVGLAAGLIPTHRRAALWLGLLAVGMSLACVYTRYHHAVDIGTGAVAGLLGSGAARLVARPRCGTPR